MTIEELIKECESRRYKNWDSLTYKNDGRDDDSFYQNIIMRLHELQFYNKRAMELAEELVSLTERTK